MQLATFVLVWCACDQPAPSRVETVLRDSAGVAMVENGGSEGLARWSVGPAPRLVIGGDESDSTTQFHGITSATRLESGDIAVGNFGTGQVFVFDPGGRRFLALGGRGGGPGEFRTYVVIVPSIGDSIIVEEVDPGRRKRVIFARTGKIVQEIIAPRPSETRGKWSDMARSPAGEAFSLFTPLEDERATRSGMVTRRRAYVVRLDLASANARRIGEYLDSEHFYADVGPQGTFGGGSVSGPRSIIQLFSATSRLDGGGEPFAIAVGDQAAAAFDVYRADGTLERRVRWDATGRRISARDLELAHEERLATSMSQRDPAAARRSLAVMPRVERTPVFSRILVDRASHVWIERYGLPTDTIHEWWVFDPGGRLVAMADVPKHLLVLEIGADYLIARASDQYDVQRVEMWPLVRNALK